LGNSYESLPALIRRRAGMEGIRQQDRQNELAEELVALLDALQVGLSSNNPLQVESAEGLARMAYNRAWDLRRLPS
jgi:hypothetical protein